MTVEVKITARRPHARAVPRPRGDHARATPAATRARPCSRTCVLRWVREECVYDLWQALGELGLGERRRARGRPTWSRCPGTDSLQARHHELDGAEPGRAGADRGDGHHRRADARAIHIKISGCPNGCGQHHVAQHRLLRRLDQGGRAHRSPPTSRTSAACSKAARSTSATRLKLRLPAKRVPTRSSAGSGTTRARAQDGETWGAFVERVGTGELEAPSRTSPCPSSSAWRR